MRALPFLVLAALVDAPRPAAACSLIGNGEHQLDTAYANDTVAPSAVTASAAVHRSADDTGCGGASSCGDLASVSIDVAATDDAAPADMLGYQLRVVGGQPPAGLTIPTEAVMSYGGGDLYFYFEYGDRSGFNFALEIRAVDLNGNLGPPTTITIGEDQATSGCSTSHGSTLGAVLLALLAVLARPRRLR
jgi:uncharacterized protein (TIGR03382 family)